MPALLYRPDQVDGQLEYVARAARQLASTGSEVLVLGPSSHNPGYDTSVDMSRRPSGRCSSPTCGGSKSIVSDAGLETALHPHWGMAIATGRDIDRLLDSSDVGICLDTGHAYLGGADPVEIAARRRERVLHVHLKDVDPARRSASATARCPSDKSVIDGLFVPLGQGAVDIAGVIETLEAPRLSRLVRPRAGRLAQGRAARGRRTEGRRGRERRLSCAASSRWARVTGRSRRVRDHAPARAQLGECPLWSPTEARLYWVDIDGRAVHRFDPATGVDEVRAAPGRPGSLALTATPGRLLVAVEGRLSFLDWASWGRGATGSTWNRRAAAIG